MSTKTYSYKPKPNPTKSSPSFSLQSRAERKAAEQRAAENVPDPYPPLYMEAYHEARRINDRYRKNKRIFNEQEGLTDHYRQKKINEAHLEAQEEMRELSMNFAQAQKDEAKKLSKTAFHCKGSEMEYLKMLSDGEKMKPDERQRFLDNCIDISAADAFRAVAKSAYKASDKATLRHISKIEGSDGWTQPIKDLLNSEYGIGKAKDLEFRMFNFTVPK